MNAGFVDVVRLAGYSACSAGWTRVGGADRAEPVLVAVAIAGVVVALSRSASRLLGLGGGDFASFHLSATASGR